MPTPLRCVRPATNRSAYVFKRPETPAYEHNVQPLCGKQPRYARSDTGAPAGDDCHATHEGRWPVVRLRPVLPAEMALE